MFLSTKIAIDLTAELWIYVLRIFIAAICGFAIGYERKTRSKEAGVRTHTIVALASALMMVVSKYAFTDIEKNYDTARIAAQVVSGMGFLGAGIIFYKRDMIRGLTTAAGMWATAGIGMAAGAGMIMTSVIITVMIVLLQIVLHRPFRALKSRTFTVIKATIIIDKPEIVDEVQYIFGAHKFLKFKTVTRPDGVVEADLEMTTEKTLTEKEIYEITNNYVFIKSLEKTDEL